jgi:hypothetical protein
VYCLCVNVYCIIVNGCQPISSQQNVIYHIPEKKTFVGCIVCSICSVFTIYGECNVISHFNVLYFYISMYAVLTVADFIVP